MYGMYWQTYCADLSWSLVFDLNIHRLFYSLYHMLLLMLSNDIETNPGPTDHVVAALNITQGSMHQGLLRFGNNAGKQCVSCCAVFFMFSEFVLVSETGHFKTADVDSVIIFGDSLYTSISKEVSHELFFPCDIPEYIEAFNHQFHFVYSEEITAHLSLPLLPGLKTLQTALAQSFAETNNAFVLAGGYCVALMKHRDTFLVFDSHARDKDGLVYSGGNSVVLVFAEFNHCCQYLMNITRSLQLTENCVVDITPVTVTSCMSGTVLPPKRWCSVERQNKASLSHGNLSCCSKIYLWIHGLL